MSFARGFNDGSKMALGVYGAYQQGKQIKLDQQKQQMLDSANAAAREAYQGYTKQFEPRTEEQVTAVSGGGAQAPAIEGGGLSLGGGAAMPSQQFGDMSQGAKPGLGGMGLATPQERVPTQQVQVQPAGKFDEREGILAGLSARRKYLMDKGADPDAWMGDWSKESQLRGAIRSERVQAAEQRFMATRDPGEYAKLVYPLIEDGMELVGTKPTKTVDGQDAWQFIRRDGQGKEVVNTMTLPEFQQFMMGVRDPKAVAEYEAKSLFERMKADEAVRQKRGEQEAVQGTERVKSKLQLGEIEARGKQERKTKGMVSGDKSAELKKPLVLGEGQIAVAPGKDGKYETKAEGRKRTLGSTAQPSAGNRVLNLRQEALDAIRRGAPQADVEREFRLATGEDLGGF